MNGMWTSVAITLAIQILVSLVVFTPPVLAPAAQSEIGVPASAVGIAIALIYLSAVFGALSSGDIIARRGPLRVSQWSLLLCAVGAALLACANLFLVIVGALIIGLGYGCVTPSSSAILADRVPANLRAFIFSLKQTGVPIGGAIAGLLLPTLILTIGWKAAALIAGGVCALLALVLQRWRAELDRDAQPAIPVQRTGLREPLELVLRHAHLRELAFASFTYSGMQMCLGSFLVVYLHEHAQLSLSAAGVGLSIAMAAGVAGRIFWGVVADHWLEPGRLLGILGVSMSVAAFVTAGFSVAWPTLLIYLVSFVYGATAVGWNGVYLSEVARIVPPSQAGKATGASLAMTYSGVVILPALFWAIVASGASYGAAFVITGCITLWRGIRLLRH